MGETRREGLLRELDARLAATDALGCGALDADEVEV